MWRRRDEDLPQPYERQLAGKVEAVAATLATATRTTTHTHPTQATAPTQTHLI